MDRTERLRLDGRGWAAAAQIEAIRPPAELIVPNWATNLDRLSKLYPLSSFQAREEEVPARLQKCGGLLALFVRTLQVSQESYQNVVIAYLFMCDYF